MNCFSCIMSRLLSKHFSGSDQLTESITNPNFLRKCDVLLNCIAALDPESSALGRLPRNVWIVKPAQTSRGVGVWLSDCINDILQSSEQVQARVVQKYVETPLLLQDNKKFDLRQWVSTKFDEASPPKL